MIKNQKKSNYLKLGLRNFGPISHGKINLKPLTIFIGENNSGKSYVAMLLHSILESYDIIQFFPSPRFPRTNRIGRFTSDFMNKKDVFKGMPDLKHQFDEICNKISEKGECEIPEKVINDTILPFFKQFFDELLTSELIGTYACELKKLIKVGKKVALLNLDSNDYQTKIEILPNRKKLNLKTLRIRSIKIKIILSDNPRKIFDVNRTRINEYTIKLDRRLIKAYKTRNLLDYVLLDALLEIEVDLIRDNVSMETFYLPAARSGIIQGHKLLAAGIVQRAPYIGIDRKFEIPKFSGVIADFISSLITMGTEQKGPLYEIGQQLEQELLGGEIKLKLPHDKSDPEIVYKTQSYEFPIYRTSSSVSELAPLILYIKYLAKPNTTLIIEEPEAHIHPYSQLILAKYLVKLIRNNVNIIFTSHSDFFVEQISDFILLSQLKDTNQMQKYGYAEDIYLNENEVGVYLFSRDKKGWGTKISEVEVTKKEGINQSNFVDVIDTLYKKTTGIKEEIEKLNNKSK